LQDRRGVPVRKAYANLCKFSEKEASVFLYDVVKSEWNGFFAPVPTGIFERDD
jgi:hypothetical protein